MIQNSKLYFRTYSAFHNALRNNQINNNAIVFIEDVKQIWTHGNFFGGQSSSGSGSGSGLDEPGLRMFLIENGYVTEDDINGFLKSDDLEEILAQKGYVIQDDIQNFVTESQLTGFVTNNQLTNLATKLDLTNYLSKAEYDDIINPMTTSIHTNQSLIEYDGQAHEITITCTAQKKGETIYPNWAITITLPNKEVVQLGNSNTDTFGNDFIFPIELSSASGGAVQISDPGTYTIVAVATYRGKSVSASKNITVVRPTYYGFDEHTAAADVQLQSFTKRLLTSAQMSQSINNNTAGRYLWIVTPFTINKIATDSGFTYTVENSLIATIDGLNYYRSSASVDISELTYYIK